MIVRTFRAVQDQIDLVELSGAIRAGNTDRAAQLIVDAQLGQMRGPVVRATRNLLEAGGDATAANVAAVSGKINAGFSFDSLDPEVVNWINSRAGRLITGINDATRQNVREIIRRAVQDGKGPLWAAKEIRKHVPILPAHSAVLDRLIRDGVPEKRVSRERARFARFRSEMIARTEVITASMEGAGATWRQAMRAGLLDPRVAVKEWVVTNDDRLCPICAPLAGEQRPLNGVFSTGDGRPPAHPMCRCSVSLRVKGGKPRQTPKTPEQIEELVRIQRKRAAEKRKKRRKNLKRAAEAEAKRKRSRRKRRRRG
jgi:hypothetical protein